jgi:hypothetical protein
MGKSVTLNHCYWVIQGSEDVSWNGQHIPTIAYVASLEQAIGIGKL